MKIQITSDSTLDLSKELIEKYDIKVLPLIVNLGDEERIDGETVTTDDIAKFVKQTGKLPKTAARSVADFVDFFKPILDAGYDIVHYSISEELSITYQNAVAAAKELDPNRIFVVNGRCLSTGTALLAINGRELASAGKTAKEIYDISFGRSYQMQVSFVVETLEYLRKGGRCSMLAAFGANLLKLKPKLQLIEGKIVSTDRYRGKSLQVLHKYIDDTLALYNNPDKTRCFITHADADPEIVNTIVEYVKSKNIFDEVLETHAGCTVFSHCGKGTLGILYINDGGKY